MNRMSKWAANILLYFTNGLDPHRSPEEVWVGVIRNGVAGVAMALIIEANGGVMEHPPMTILMTLFGVLTGLHLYHWDERRKEVGKRRKR